MAKGANDPKALLEHGGAVKDAVSSAVEKAKKSAEQHKPGWQLGATAKGSPTSGTSVMFTLTSCSELGPRDVVATDRQQ